MNLSQQRNQLNESKISAGKKSVATKDLLFDQKLNGHPNLSVKKQLRLQKMALQGIDYRPKQEERKIFDKNDMREYFRAGLDKFDVSPNRDQSSIHDVSKKVTSFGIGSHDILQPSEQDGLSVLKSEQLANSMAQPSLLEMQSSLDGASQNYALKNS